jgi:hypothetical protein
MKRFLLLVTVLFAGCAEVPYQGYVGGAKPETEVATVRLWTPTTTNVFTSPGLIMQKIDGIQAGDVGRASHAYLLPGEHEFEVGFIQVKTSNLLCGALCNSIFTNQPLSRPWSNREGSTFSNTPMTRTELSFLKIKAPPIRRTA